jgi:hypothetical protein
MGGGLFLFRFLAMSKTATNTATMTTTMITIRSVIQDEDDEEPEALVTVRVVDLVALCPALSLTQTTTLNVPVALGVHESDAVLLVEQPLGSPAYAYVSVPVPPLATTVRVVALPTVTDDGLAANDEIEGPPGTCVTTNETLLLTLWLAISLTVTVTLNEPADVGRHGRKATSAVGQPLGSPAYEYDNVPVPPLADTVKFVHESTTTGEGLTLKLVMERGVPTVFTITSTAFEAEA